MNIKQYDFRKINIKQNKILLFYGKNDEFYTNLTKNMHKFDKVEEEAEIVKLLEVFKNGTKIDILKRFLNVKKEFNEEAVERILAVISRNYGDTIVEMLRSITEKDWRRLNIKIEKIEKLQDEIKQQHGVQKVLKENTRQLKFLDSLQKQIVAEWGPFDNIITEGWGDYELPKEIPAIIENDIKIRQFKINKLVERLIKLQDLSAEEKEFILFYKKFWESPEYKNISSEFWHKLLGAVIRGFGPGPSIIQRVIKDNLNNKEILLYFLPKETEFTTADIMRPLLFILIEFNSILKLKSDIIAFIEKQTFLSKKLKEKELLLKKMLDEIKIFSTSEEKEEDVDFSSQQLEDKEYEIEFNDKPLFENKEDLLLKYDIYKRNNAHELTLDEFKNIYLSRNSSLVVKESFGTCSQNIKIVQLGNFLWQENAIKLFNKYKNRFIKQLEKDKLTLVDDLYKLQLNEDTERNYDMAIIIRDYISFLKDKDLSKIKQNMEEMIVTVQTKINSLTQVRVNTELEKNK